MSEVNLLIFGCGVSFIALAGFYVYLRKSFTADDSATEPETRPIQSGSKTKSVEPKALDAA